jgi:PIN domain nuclease of toxin-antitoxin system
VILIDTCVLLRTADGVALPAALKRALAEDAWAVSGLSACEIAIKHAMGKLPLDAKPERWWPRVVSALGLTVEPFTDRQALIAGALPMHHADPFDRGIIATAIASGLPLATVDARLLAYRDCAGLRVIGV